MLLSGQHPIHDQGRDHHNVLPRPTTLITSPTFYYSDCAYRDYLANLYDHDFHTLCNNLLPCWSTRWKYVYLIPFQCDCKDWPSMQHGSALQRDLDCRKFASYLSEPRKIPRPLVLPHLLYLRKSQDGTIVDFLSQIKVAGESILLSAIKDFLFSLLMGKAPLVVRFFFDLPKFPRIEELLGFKCVSSHYSSFLLRL